MSPATADSTVIRFPTKRRVSYITGSLEGREKPPNVERLRDHREIPNLPQSRTALVLACIISQLPGDVQGKMRRLAAQARSQRTDDEEMCAALNFIMLNTR